MLQTKTITTSWGIGLSREQAALLRETLGEDHELVLYPAVAGNNAEHGFFPGEPAPHVVWVSSGVCKNLASLPQALAHHSEPALIVMLLDDDYTLEDFECACDNGISEIIRPPVTSGRIMEIMRRAMEVRAVHTDMDSMTREIILERELLERKNEILGFLVNFLTNTTESLDVERLLQTAYTGLKKLLPVRTLQAALWDSSVAASPAATFYISAPEGSSTYESWRASLMNQARLTFGGHFNVEQSLPLELNDRPGHLTHDTPQNGALLPIPLVCGKERIGLLLLLLDADRHLGRDQAMALDSAMRHFALSIKNARRFRLMQMYADYDALTRVHSRRHFEIRLEEEMQRFTRYGQPLSMLMLDLDHFKRVNDEYGHHVGDLVLKDAAALIHDSVRTTDYCARYGGEEFVVLLPYTGMKRAAALADRIRERISRHVFLADGGRPVHVTMSIGVGHVAADTPKSKQALICSADAALYKAKGDGRNRVCTETDTRLVAVHTTSKVG